MRHFLTQVRKIPLDPEGTARNSCNSWPLYTRWADQRQRASFF